MGDVLEPGQLIDNRRYSVVKRVDRDDDRNNVFSQIYVVQRTSVGTQHVFKLNLTDEEVLKFYDPNAVNPTVKDIIEKTTYESRVENEKQALQHLSWGDHPNICNLYDIIDVDGHKGFLLDKVSDCETLADLIYRIHDLDQEIDDAFPNSKVDKIGQAKANFVMQIAKGVDYMISKGYLHKDLKPGNIIVDSYGRLRIIDFGLACRVYQPNGLWGTRMYAPPEKYFGREHKYSDVWSAGLIAERLFRTDFPFPTERDEFIADMAKLSVPDFRSSKQDEVKKWRDDFIESLKGRKKECMKSASKFKIPSKFSKSFFEIDKSKISSDFGNIWSGLIFLSEKIPAAVFMILSLNINPDDRFPDGKYYYFDEI